MSVPRSLEVFAENVRRTIEKIRGDFDSPTDDWTTVMIAENEALEGFVIPFDPKLFDGELSKDVVALMMRATLEGVGARRMALVMSTWQLRGDPDDPEKTMREAEEWRGRFGEHPDRREALVLTCADADHEFVEIAEIKRDGTNPPTLDEWVRMDRSSGRFAGWQEALRGE